MDEELPVKQNNTIQRNSQEVCIYEESYFFKSMCERFYGLLAFRGWQLIQPRSPKWLLWGSFLSCYSLAFKTSDWMHWLVPAQQTQWDTDMSARTVKCCHMLVESQEVVLHFVVFEGDFRVSDEEWARNSPGFSITVSLPPSPVQGRIVKGSAVLQSFLITGSLLQKWLISLLLVLQSTTFWLTLTVL